MRRKVRIFAITLLLAVCLATVAVWRLSFSREISFGISRQYRIRISDGFASLWKPPLSRSRPYRVRQVEEVVSSLNNDQCFWDAAVRGDSLGNVIPKSGGFIDGLPRVEAVGLGREELGPPLLDALDDPEKIAAAHILLQKVYAMSIGSSGSSCLIRVEQKGHMDADGSVPPRSVVLLSDGLRVELWPDGAYWVDGSRAPRFRSNGRAFVLDPSSFTTVRDSWHRRLDVRAASLPILPVALLAAIPGIVSGLRIARAKMRIPDGACRACRYDLTGNTSGTCPECGTPIPQAFRSA